MAETVRSLFDYREPPTLDSDGEGSKPPPPRGRGCGRKRKGTPVKVCDRVFVTEDEEESLSEHSYCPGDGQYQEGEEDRLPPPDGPYYLADPAQLCVSELGEEGGSGARTAVLYPPPPNCRIREVHCGSQVRLVVIAIRDIAKGEEITVDYSLTEWGENAMGFHSSVSPGGFECSSDAENNVKKEEESGPVSLSLSVSDYLTPSWSLSPSSSPLSHSEPSDSDREEEEDEEDEDPQEHRGRMLRRRKKRKGAPGAKKKAGPRTPGRPALFSRAPPQPARARPLQIAAHPTPPQEEPRPLHPAQEEPGPAPLHSAQEEPRPAPLRHAQEEPGSALFNPAQEGCVHNDHAQEGWPQEVVKEAMQEENGMREEESGGEEKKGAMSSSRRPHMMPLLSSLSSLVMYLRRLQHSAFLSLSRSPQSAEAWRLLCHASLALLILYNRRREASGAGAAPHPAPHSEPCLELLLQTRPGVGVDPQNPYVFARPYHSPATPLRARTCCGAWRAQRDPKPRALTQTRLRRQVAILTQLLLLGEGEGQGAGSTSASQRLESFLQKEYHVTQSCARIGQDPGLMGRVGRVVLCGERDGVLFRGMSLHHICLELDVMSGNSADSFSDDSDGEQGKEKAGASSATMGKKGVANGKSPRQRKGNAALPNSASPFASPNGRRKGAGQPKPGKRGVLKRPWSEAERTAVESHLTRNIMELRVPAKADCERCLQLCPLLVTNRRDWRAIKFYCHNRIQLLKKRERRESLSAMGAPPMC
ncbi:hypothetical protein ANANG_G00096630 [Anguilla anguilla]|uniref:SET domain-containing protein n=1 Tax=Anguilla anguilla TaxID=7936 RepID=A0A9D3RYB3_ANGAN|nr:hypothetical protein ANANG_G00096630 [Anguilla anguilla]